MNANTEAPQQARRIEDLIGKLESGDPAVVAIARDLVQALIELQGAGLERMIGMIRQAGAAGQEILDRLSRDELVGTLLTLYDLHPLDLDTRVRRGVEKLQGRVRSQGSVELIGIEEGVVRIRVRASGSGCGSSAGSLKSAVEEAIYEAAPDAVRLVIEGIDEAGAASGFVPIEKLLATRGAHQ